jgi:signal transduction histidine kinase
MSLRLRFLLSLLAMLALMALPAVYAAGRVNQLRDIVLELRGQAAQAGLAAGRLQAAVDQVDRYQRVYVATGDPDFAQRVRDALAAMTGEIELLRVAGYGDVVAAGGLHVEALQATVARTEQLVETGQLDSATVFVTTAAMPVLAQAHGAIPAIAAAIDMKTADRVVTAERSARAAGAAARIALLISVVVALALAVSVARLLSRPVERIRLAMARVAEGTFETPADLPYDRADELGHLSRSFRTMTFRLAELDRLKAEFVGTASHDLKTPISIINGYAELLQEELHDVLRPRHHDLLRAMIEQTHSLQRRVEQLLEISRMEAGRLRLGLEEIDLRHFTEEVRRAFEPAARLNGLRFEVDVHHGAHPVLVADPDVLRTDVLGNLIGNALKFTPAGGTIRLNVRRDGPHIHLEVVDTGPGIPPDQLEHIFEKYYQGRGSRGGAGLGLAITRAAVEAHGGRIEVQSWVGRGSRFRVVLPAGVTMAEAALVASRN